MSLGIIQEMHYFFEITRNGLRESFQREVTLNVPILM